MASLPCHLICRVPQQPSVRFTAKSQPESPGFRGGCESGKAAPSRLLNQGGRQPAASLRGSTKASRSQAQRSASWPRVGYLLAPERPPCRGRRPASERRRASGGDVDSCRSKSFLTAHRREPAFHLPLALRKPKLQFPLPLSILTVWRGPLHLSALL